MKSVFELDRSSSPAAQRGRGDDQSCRTMLDDLEGMGELLVVDKPVSARFDISAMLSLVDARGAVRFDRVEGRRCGFLAIF